MPIAPVMTAHDPHELRIEQTGLSTVRDSHDIFARILAWLEWAPETMRFEAVALMAHRLVRPFASKQERDLLETALIVVLDDPSPRIRRQLAEILSRHSHAPRHLVTHLCRDLAFVAEPLFSASPLLGEAELTEAIESENPLLQSAIARRAPLSSSIMDLLAMKGGRSALLTLLGNEALVISPAAFATMIGRFSKDGIFCEALLARSDLPLPLRHQLIVALGQRLDHLIATRGWTSSQQARNFLRDAAESAAIDLALLAKPEECAEILAYLRESGQLTSALLLRALARGSLFLFESALGLLCHLPTARVSALLQDGRQTVMTALLRRAGVPIAYHEAFRAAATAIMDKKSTRSGDGADYYAAAVLAACETIDPEPPDHLLLFLRRLAAEEKRTNVLAAVQNLRPLQERAA